MIDTVVAVSPTVVRQQMSGLAIVGGWIVALGIAWLFYVLGLAVGFSSFDVSDPAMTARGVGIGTTVWVVLTWAVSLFLGGMFASWMDGRSDPTVGTLHGVAVWGLAMSVTALLAAVGSTSLLQGGASLLHGSATAAATAASAEGGPGRARGAPTPFGHATGTLAAQVKRAVAQRNANSALDSATASAIAVDLLRGKTDDATARLAADAGLQPSDAASLVQSLSPQVSKFKAEVEQAADQARRYAAAGLWAVFFSGFIALVAAALGGWAGAGHIHRVYDFRPSRQ